MIRQHSLENIKAYFGPIDLTLGADRDSAVTIDPIGEVWTIVKGNGGGFARVRASSVDMVLTAVLSAYSPSHLRLMQTLTADGMSGLGAWPVSYINTTTGVAYVCAAGVISGYPQATIGENAPYHAWTIQMPQTMIQSGSNVLAALRTPG